MMSKILFFIGCLVAVFFAIYCISTHRHEIQSDIMLRGAHALRGDNLNDSRTRAVDLDVDGRDVTLNGYVPTQDIKDDIYNRATNVWGVRKVINNIQLTPPEPPPIQPEIQAEVTFEPVVQDIPILIPEPEPEPELIIEDVVVEPPPIEPVAQPEPQRIPTKAVVKALQTPTKEAVEQSSVCEKTLRDMLAKETILFTTGSANIQNQSFDLLNRIAREAKNCPSSLILVEGHTDSSGADANNLILSKKRAGAVVDYLVAKGVEQPLRFVGYGENKPVANNNTAAGREQNRRIEFKVQAIKR